MNPSAEAIKMRPAPSAVLSFQSFTMSFLVGIKPKRMKSSVFALIITPLPI